MAAEGGLFRKRQELQQPQPLEQDLMELARRSRTLEERYSNLEKRSQVTEENMIAHHRKIASELKTINDDISEIKKAVAELNDKMQTLISELRDFSRKEDVEVLKKYISYWDPVKFVTQNEVEKIVGEMLEEKKE